MTRLSVFMFGVIALGIAIFGVWIAYINDGQSWGASVAGVFVAGVAVCIAVSLFQQAFARRRRKN